MLIHIGSWRNYGDWVGAVPRTCLTVLSCASRSGQQSEESPESGDKHTSSPGWGEPRSWDWVAGLCIWRPRRAGGGWAGKASRQERWSEVAGKMGHQRREEPTASPYTHESICFIKKMLTMGQEGS